MEWKNFLEFPLNHHIDASDSRINEDSEAVDEIADFLKIHKPFPNIQVIQNPQEL